MQHFAKPNMRPLVVAETGSWAAPAPGSQPLHYCTFQLTPSLSFLSRCAIVCFVMRIKMKILSSQGGHFLATISVFSIQCFHCIMWLWWGWNISMWPSLCLRFVIVFVFVFSVSIAFYDEDENEDRDFQRTRSHFRATIFLFRMLVSVAPYLPHSYGHILILTWWGTHFSCVSNLEVFWVKGVHKMQWTVDTKALIEKLILPLELEKSCNKV